MDVQDHFFRVFYFESVLFLSREISKWITSRVERDLSLWTIVMTFIHNPFHPSHSHRSGGSRWKPEPDEPHQYQHLCHSQLSTPPALSYSFISRALWLSSRGKVVFVCVRSERSDSTGRERCRVPCPVLGRGTSKRREVLGVCSRQYGGLWLCNNNNCKYNQHTSSQHRNYYHLLHSRLQSLVEENV